MSNFCFIEGYILECSDHISTFQQVFVGSLHNQVLKIIKNAVENYIINNNE